jgi:cobalamin biosynthesis Mg chelatase CobN
MMVVFKPLLTVLISVATLLPLGALADDASLLGPSSTTSTAPSNGAATVGPASTQTSSLLQPAGTSNGSTLQSADASGGGAAQAASGQALQQTGSADQAKLLVFGDADGSPVNPDDTAGTPWWEYALLGLLALVLLGAAIWLLRRRPKAAKPQ